MRWDPERLREEAERSLEEGAVVCGGGTTGRSESPAEDHRRTEKAGVERCNSCLDSKDSSNLLRCCKGTTLLHLVPKRRREKLGLTGDDPPASRAMNWVL